MSFRFAQVYLKPHTKLNGFQTRQGFASPVLAMLGLRPVRGSGRPLTRLPTDLVPHQTA
jgi:hypothetical protein